MENLQHLSTLPATLATWAPPTLFPDNSAYLPACLLPAQLFPYFLLPTSISAFGSREEPQHNTEATYYMNFTSCKPSGLTFLTKPNLNKTLTAEVLVLVLDCYMLFGGFGWKTGRTQHWGNVGWMQLESGITFNILVDTVWRMKQYEDKWSHDFLCHAEKNASPSTLAGTLFQREKGSACRWGDRGCLTA